MLNEYWDTTDDELDESKQDSKLFQIKYSSENLMKKAIKKAAYNLRLNANKARKRMIKQNASD